MLEIGWKVMVREDFFRPMKKNGGIFACYYTGGSDDFSQKICWNQELVQTWVVKMMNPTTAQKKIIRKKKWGQFESL